MPSVDPNKGMCAKSSLSALYLDLPFCCGLSPVPVSVKAL